MGKFLNSEIAREEEAAARENQQSAELLDALGRIAELNMKLLAMSEVVGEMALENAMLRTEIKVKSLTTNETGVRAQTAEVK